MDTFENTRIFQTDTAKQEIIFVNKSEIEKKYNCFGLYEKVADRVSSSNFSTRFNCLILDTHNTDLTEEQISTFVGNNEKDVKTTIDAHGETVILFRNEGVVEKFINECAIYQFIDEEDSYRLEDTEVSSLETEGFEVGSSQDYGGFIESYRYWNGSNHKEVVLVNEYGSSMYEEITEDYNLENSVYLSGSEESYGRKSEYYLVKDSEGDKVILTANVTRWQGEQDTYSFSGVDNAFVVSILSAEELEEHFPEIVSKYKTSELEVAYRDIHNELDLIEKVPYLVFSEKDLEPTEVSNYFIHRPTGDKLKEQRTIWQGDFSGYLIVE